MNKKTLIFVTVLLVLALGLFTLTGCTKEEEEVAQDNEPIANTETEETNTVKEETSDIDVESLSDEEKIEHFLFLELKEAYGDKMASAKIYVDKMYKAEDTKNDPTLKDLKLGEKDIAFESTINFEPAEGADPIEFTVPNGEYNEETGWVQDASRLGVLRATDDGYEITNLGTGW